MAANVGTAYVQVRGDLSSLNKQLVANLHPSRLGKLGKTAGIAVGVGLGAGLAAGSAGKALFDIGKQFDEQFDKIRTATGQTGKSLKGLEGDFKAVLKTVPADFETVGTAVAGLNQRLGLTGAPLQKLSRQIVTLSRVTKTDIGENVESITRLFGDWSVKTGRQSKSLDRLFRVSQKTGIPISNLSRLMVAFGSPLRQLGFDFDTAAAMFGRFEREGVNIQTIMPGFRFALKNLSAPTGEVADALKKLGASGDEPRVALQKVFDAIKKAPTDLKANALAFTIFGKRAGPDMAAAIREGRFELDSLLKSMSRGDTIRKAGRDTEDFSEKWQRLKNNILVGLEPVASRFFDSVSKDMARVGKVLSDPKLSTEEKWDRIGDVLSSRLESGINIASETAARLAPKVAGAFVRGFIQAPPLIQLLTGTFLFAKGRKMIAAMGLLGTQSGAAFGTGFGAGAAGGGAGGAAGGAGAGAAVGGLAGFAGRLKGFAKAGIWAGIGITLAEGVLKGAELHLDRHSKDLNKRLEGMTKGFGDFLPDFAGTSQLGDAINLFAGGSDQASQLKSILDKVKEGRRGITAEEAKEASQLARNLDLTRQQRREVQRTLDIGRQKASPGAGVAGIAAQLKEAGRLTPGLINNISAQLEDLPRKTRPKFAQAVLDWATELKRTGKIKGSLGQLKNVIESEVDGVGSLSVRGPRRLKDRMAAGFEAMVGAVADPTSRMAQIVQTYLDAFGAAGVDKIAGAIARDKATRAKGHQGGLAQGGFLGGKGLKDTVPIMAAPGEAVLNRHQQAPVETALRSTYGYGLDDLFRKQRKPHYMAKGGRVGGIVPIPGQPGESIHASILQDVLSLIRKYHLKVTDGFAPSGHAAGGEHPKGLAIDVVPAGGNWDLVDKLAHWAEPKQGSPRAPFRWVGYTGDPGHGRGNHLHLSWGGGGSAAIAPPDLPQIKITGPDSASKDLAKAATRQVRRAAQSFLDKQSATAPVGTSSDPGLGGNATANKRLAKSLMHGIFPASEFGALSTLWQGESGWDEGAVNPSSGAGGIPQALPASKMGKGWQGNAAQQIKWGLNYIKSRYGSPSAALAAWQSRSPHWYAQGGFVDPIFAAAGLAPAFRAKDKKDTKPKNLKAPPKGGPSPGKNFIWDKLAHKWKRRKRKGGDGFQLKQLDFLKAALENTIPGINERIDSIEGDFDLADLEHYPDERAVPRLRREGHNIQKLGDSFVDWSAVDQSKSFLGQILGESFRLIGTPFGAPRGVMEIVRDAFPSLDSSVTGIVKRLTGEINDIRAQIRENLRELRRQQKEIDALDEKLSKERDRKKPDKSKLARWNKEKDERQDRVNALRRENRRLTGESEPTGELSGIDKGTLGERQTRLSTATDALEQLKEDRKTFLGSSGVGGDFASAKGEITRRVKDLGALTTERITEAVGPTTATDEFREQSQAFLASLGDLKKQFGSNFKIIKPSFEGGGVVKGPIGKPVDATVHGGELVIDPRTGALRVTIDQDRPLSKAERLNVVQNLHFTTPPENQHAVQKAALFELEASV